MSITEAAFAKTQLGADLAAGINTLDLDQTVTFTKYVRTVLPLDGFVYWIRADLLSPSALLNAAVLNSVTLNQPQTVITPAATITAAGALHYASAINQNADETIAINQVVFTSESPIEDLDQTGPNCLYIATYGPDGIRFAFSQRRPFFQVADLFHYMGDAVYPVMETQLVDSLDGFDFNRVVVSNSLPIWLSLNNYTPPYPGFGNAQLPLYPAYLVPDNLPPIYGAIEIRDTRAMQSAAVLGPTLTHSQLVRETVKITMYGMRNFDALWFLDCVNQFSLDTDQIGIMNMPAVSDEYRTQSELAVLAMKKSITFEVNYYQSVARDIARQLILQAIPTYTVGSWNNPLGALAAA